MAKNFLLSFTTGLVLALAIVGIILSCVYIYHFMKIQKLHKSPGDIYLGMSIAELIFMIHCLSDSIVVFSGQAATFPKSHATLCYVNLVSFTLAVLLLFSYTIQLYLNMIIRLIYTMQSKKIKKWQGHMLTVTISSLYSLISIASQNQEYCGLSLTKTAPFTFIIFLISFYAMAITARVYIRDQIAQSSDEKIIMQGEGFLSYMKRLYVAQAINMTAFILFLMIAYILELLASKTENQNQNKGAILIFSMLAQIAATLYPVIIPIIRYTDPFVWKHIQKYYIARPSQDTSDISLIEQQSYDINSPNIQQPKISFDNHSLQLIDQNFKSFQGSDSQELKKLNSMSTDKGRANTMKSVKKEQQRKQEDPFIHQFTSQLRSEIIKRIIAFILLKEKDEQKLIKHSQYFKKTIRRQSNDDFHEQATFNVNQIVLNQSFPNYFKQQNRQFKMISYSPVIFNILIKEDIEQLDISNCLDMDFNAEQIKQCAQTTGGKSGEFFFFNHNNKVLLKTVTVSELQILVDRLENYFWHCTNNPNTTIAKILGIYTFEGFETGRLTLILMKNIGKVNRLAFFRMYDIKGSRHDREVIKINKDNNQQEQIEIPQNQVLKDLDFIKLEKQMNISPQQKTSILEQLQIDTLFLKQQGFMDYSLCIIIVDWFGFYKQELIEIDDEEFLLKLIHQKVSKLQHCYQNTQHPGLYYHLGIIDYLQTYNIQKKTEKYAKKFLKMDTNLDTSSQNPYEYRKRFLTFMQEVL